MDNDHLVEPLLSPSKHGNLNYSDDEDGDPFLRTSTTFPSTTSTPSTPNAQRKTWKRGSSEAFSRVVTFVDDRTKSGLVLSRRAWTIYGLFFVPPFILTLIWLILPLYNYPWYCFSISLYYSFAFLAWISFYNILIPGCPAPFKLIGFIAFVIPLIYFLATSRNSSRKNDKLGYSIIHLITFATTALAYFIYTLYHKVRRFFQEKYRMGESERDEKNAEMPSRLAHKLCFFSTIDHESLHTWESYKPGSQLNDRVVTWKNFIIVSLYQLVVICVWVWLQEFTDLVIFRKKFESGFGALASIIIFQTSKIVLIGVCGFVNSLLPATPYDTVTHFTLFQLQFSFLLFYRTLFMSFSGWVPTILVAVVTLAFDVLYYPVRMKFSIYNFRYVTLKSKAEARGYDTKYPQIYNMLFKENLSYEEVTNVMCIEYYYEKISEYYSLLSTVIFISMLRALDYHHTTYTSFTLLTNTEYRLLLLRYLFLFGFETSTDIILRLFTKHKMNIDISNKGRNYTISNYITRFLFTTFMIYDLFTVYYSQINVSFH